MMGNTKHSKLLFIGLPGTGKTTFLAALWHVVNSKEIDCSLKLAHLHTDHSYLRHIRNDWIDCNQLNRTNINSNNIVKMKLQCSRKNKITEIVFPDLSGEMFTLQLKERKWSREYGSLVAESDGIFLFIHPYTINQPKKLIDAKVLPIDILDKPEGFNDKEQDEINNWEVENMPTQVQLVELLQFIASKIGSSNTRRLAVVISAWDLVRDYPPPKKKLEQRLPCPKRWIHQRLPLLDQYLVANKEQFFTRIYGISAQGDKIENSTKLHEFDDASKRIIVVGKDCLENDITAPLKWVMG